MSLHKVPERPAERPQLGRAEGRGVSARCPATDVVPAVRSIRLVVPKSWPLSPVDPRPRASGAGGRPPISPCEQPCGSIHLAAQAREPP